MAVNFPGATGPPAVGVTGSADTPGAPDQGGVSGQTGPGTVSGPNFGAGAIAVGPASAGPGTSDPAAGVTGQANVGSVDLGGGVYGSYPGVPGADWQATHQGAAMNDGYQYFRKTFTTDMPSLRQQLAHLATRPIGG